MTEQVRPLWAQQVKEDMLVLAMTRDGNSIFVGGTGALYCINLAGDILWRSNLDGLATKLILAEGSMHVLAGTSGGQVYLWDYQGHLLRVLESQGYVAGLSSTATIHRIAVGTLKGELTLYDASGQQLWQRSLPGPIRHLTLTSDGDRLVLGCEDNSIYCFGEDGDQLWRFRTDDRVWAGATLSSSYVLAGSNDKHIYCLDHTGTLLWKADTGSEVNRVMLTSDGLWAAAGGNGHTLHLWQTDGTLRWKASTPGIVHTLGLSQDGRFAAVGTDGQAVVLFDAQGKQLWKQEMRGAVYGLAMTPNGRLVAAVATDNTVSLVENQLADAVNSEQWQASRIIRQVRELYRENEPAGIAHWFECFDQSLKKRELVICEQMMQELHEGKYILSGDEEKRWVESREGTLWLYQGMRHQQLGEEELARQDYERSKQRQEEINYLQGEGAALMALKTLGSQQGSQHTALFALLTEQPELIGNSEKLLEQRLKSFTEPAQQYQLVRTSLQMRYLLPLLAAQSLPTPFVQITASTALPWLNPGPSMEVLLDLLSSPHWIVRWQALLMLARSTQQLPQTTALYQERIRQKMHEFLLQEYDPLVLRSLAILLRSIGDAAHVPGLLTLLQDPDPEVRLETVITLGKLGGRDILSELPRVTIAHNADEQMIDDQSALARHAIRQRIPLAQIQQMLCCPVITDPRPTKTTSTFLTYNPEIHCLVTVRSATPGLRVRCIIRASDQKQEPLEREIQLSTHDFQPGQQPDAHQSLNDWLYRLLAEEDQNFWSWREDDSIDPLLDQTKEVIFSFVHARQTWFPGIYTVEIALNDVVKYKSSFSVVSREAMKFAPAYYRKGLFFHRLGRYQEALADYKQALIFAPHHVNALCNKGDIDIMRNRLKEAGESYEHAFRLDANRALTHFCMEGALHLLGTNRTGWLGVALFQAFVANADPTSLSSTVPILTQLSDAALTWLVEGQEQAMHVIEQAIQEEPASLVDIFASIAGLALLQRQEEALALLEKQRPPSSSTTLNTALRASCLALAGQQDKAFPLLDAALYEKPQILALSITKALIKMYVRRWEEALSILEQALSNDPNSIALLALKGIVLHLLGRDKEMVATYQQAVDMHPELPITHLCKVVAVMLSGQLEEALSITESLLLTHPACVLADGLAIFILIMQKQKEQAADRCERLLQTLPNSALVHFMLSQLVSQEERSAKALEMARGLGLIDVPQRLQNLIGTNLNK